MTNGKLELIFIWHMHQPDYRDHARGEFTLPWVYLHALKDYTDMAAHLERHPRVHAVVNLVPVLVDQLEDYAAQFAARTWRDPLLRLLAHEHADRYTAAERKLLLASCFRSNHTSMIAPFAHYKRLLDLFQIVEGRDEAALAYLSGAYFADLITWYHLAWIGETERRRQPLIAELMAKGEGYTTQDRARLIALMGEVIAGIIPRYRALNARGQIELSTTPHTHPLAPLLVDFSSARESEPNIELPTAPCYPGGRARTSAQLEHAMAGHTARFGARPLGVWPAEGAVSNALLKLLAGAGCRWTATSESVLAASLRQATPALQLQERDLSQPYRVSDATGMTMFFRNDRLSDLIGFEYRNWHGKDAAADFVGRLHAIRKQIPEGEKAVVTVILDGENAWEYYPYNGYYFFEDLYAQLDADDAISTTTCTDYMARHPHTARALPSVVAGSWVYGTFSTWIGHPAKNRAWDLLCEAKLAYDLVIGGHRLSPKEERAAAAQLAVCESSDWFWWRGTTNAAHSEESFDRLYRLNLFSLYRCLKIEPPAALGEPINQDERAAEGSGTMHRAA